MGWLEAMANSVIFRRTKAQSARDLALWLDGLPQLDFAGACPLD
jgi:hypothetical protein